MIKLVCFLDISHPVLQNGYLSPDPRFNKVSGAFSTKIEIDVEKLSQDEQRYSVLRNVSIEAVDASWVKQMRFLAGNSWVAETEPEDWPRVVTATFDIDFSEARVEQVFAKIINVQHRNVISI